MFQSAQSASRGELIGAENTVRRGLGLAGFGSASTGIKAATRRNCWHRVAGHVFRLMEDHMCFGVASSWLKACHMSDFLFYKVWVMG